MFIYRRSTVATIMLALGLLLGAAYVQAQIAVTNKIADVRGTKHNLSSVADGTATPSGGTVPVRTVKASPTGTGETQVCVFCHTPHGATAGIVAPLWNRTLLPTQTYTPYASSSLEASATELGLAPGGSSKLCLSCHDGTMAIDKVNVLNGASNVTIAMTGLTGAAGSGKLPATTATTGFTRNLGTNLRNDHPISFTYNSTIAGYDGELRAPDGATVGNRVAGGTKPKMPLENNQMQCATCHDPHLRDKTTTNGNAKFLRVNRFQVDQPVGGVFIPGGDPLAPKVGGDIICIACHDKGGVAWAYSAHANKSVATQTYKTAAANTREFPLNAGATAGPPVWQVACLNCHDTHTVQGANKLLREGTDNTSVPKVGGNAAQEETCYQCHSNTTDSVVATATPLVNAVPDIKTDFTTAGNKRMPITSVAQLAGTESHDIGGAFNDGAKANCSNTGGTGNCGKDLLESRVKLGSTNLNNRHAECSDCHNPHRVIKYKDGLPGTLSLLTFNNTGLSASGTHKHTDDNADIHTNVISGVLRGSWGVEPSYGNNSFHLAAANAPALALALTFAVKRGDPGINAAPAAGSRPGAETYVTREYQICLKCHSNYAYPDDNVYPNSANRPQLGGSGLTLATRTNDGRTHTAYTNQAKEFQAPSTHAVPVGSVSLGFDGGAGTSAAVTATNNNNHRSWHPVMAPTGRTGRAGAWLAPWNNSGTGFKAGRLGVQTMYCSDCHGSNTAATTVIPTGGDNGAPWGPHGSANNFLLKGIWDTTSGEVTADDRTGNPNVLCFRCHDGNAYSGGGGTGWSGGGRGDLHAHHSNNIDNPMRCNWCHVAVPHGWKNRGLLVNLTDVGPEAGRLAGTDVGNGPYTAGPYYRRAYLRITSFPVGGAWTAGMCNGGRAGMKSQCETAT